MTFNSLDGSPSSDHIKLCLITAVWRVRETGARPETGSAHLCTPKSRGDALSVYKYLDRACTLNHYHTLSILLFCYLSMLLSIQYTVILLPVVLYFDDSFYKN